MYKFTDIENSEIPTGESKMKNSGGCYVKTATGFVIALLSIAIAVGVGLIVHFAENRKIECAFPDGFNSGGGNIQAQSGGEQQPMGLTSAPAVEVVTTKVKAAATSKATTVKTTTVPRAPTEPCPTLPSTPSPTTSQPPTVALKDVRLPTALKPTHYTLRITPQMYGDDPSRFTFDGHVKIDMNCLEPTNNVTLHINELNISSINFGSTTDSTSPRYRSHTEDKDRQFLIVNLDKETARGKAYFVEMNFVGHLKDDMKGLYLTTFKQGDQIYYAASTQFEPTDARKTFPCFDEPQLKASFDVTLVKRSNLESISNMPRINSVAIANNMVEDHYQTTEVMSTYLLAFVVGDFAYKEGRTARGLLYRAWSTPDAVNQTLTALDVGTKTIYNYEKYFGIDFPLPKQDMIAIPDFAAGAMENWGLITYREAGMLFQPGMSSERNLQKVTTLLTHEVGHQWFGNLVTMRWWDDLWLNEGFATFVEYMGAHLIHPDWQLFEQFVVDEVHDAFEFDALATSHPIYVPVNNPDEINEIFDKISYSKGGSVIRMMRFILDEETFKKGLHRYLDSLQYQNAFHDDLWTALANQSKIDGHLVRVKEIMDTWTLQMNYPVVRVTVQNGKINIRQTRFLSNPDATDPGKYTSSFGYKWKIPFTFTTSDNPNFNVTRNDIHWLDNESNDITYAGVQDKDWVMGNMQQYGFYRVTYDDKNWMALTNQLKKDHKVFHPINRAQLINDAWSLAKAGQLSTDIALHTLEYLGKELEYVPWAAAQKQLSYLDSMLSKTDLYGQFENFMKSILMDPFKHFGMDDTNSSHIQSYIRSDIAKMACSYGITECITGSKRLFKQWMDNPSINPIDPDLRELVYCTAVAEGAEEEWNFTFDQFKKATVASEKVKLTKAMACTKSTWILSRYLNIAITPTVIRKQDATKVLIHIASNTIGQPLAWDFVRSNWNYLLNEYGKGVFSFSNLIAGLTSSFNTEFQLSQLQDFIVKYPYMGTGSRAFEQAIEKTQRNMKWMTQNIDSITNWLSTVTKVATKQRVKDVRLPLHLVPTTYDLTLKPNMYSDDPSSFTFDGYIKIHMDAKFTGRNVTVHTNKLTIDDSTIQFGKEDGSAGPVYTGQRTHDSDRQFEIFSLDKDVIAGEKYYIEMNFTGPLTGDLAGFYLSTYQRGNDTVYIATTQMEPTDARKAFPCFDEPQIKAYYNVKLIRKDHLKSISNMPIIHTEKLSGNFEMDVYNTSAKMSTYLLAFIVCDFEYTEDYTTKGLKYRAWARPESINQTRVALKAGTTIIDYYEDYFGIHFPLPKQDMIAVPDFSAGAMENWGLITYRETAMLYEKGVSSEGNLQRVNVVIAHELAHQWFGDLVTMDWWDDLWLNEGFASFVEYMGVDHLHPDWKMWFGDLVTMDWWDDLWLNEGFASFVEYMGVDHLHPDWKMFEQFVFDLYEVFEMDALVTSHPMYVPVNNPDEINEIFDSISYSKGASIIRMMRFFLGEKTFQKGVQLYLKSRKYQNAKHNDLWWALDEAAKKENQTISVRGIMDTWILQMNCPVVKVSRSSSGNILLEQKRFLTNAEAVDPGKYQSPYNYTWRIPFTFTTEDAPNFNQSKDNIFWLNGPHLDVPRLYPTKGKWIIGNIQQYGVHRVNYDDDNWLAIIKQLKSDHQVIHVINRAQVINDGFGLAKADQLSMSIALQTLEYLQNEEEYIPWQTASSELSYIDMMLSETNIYGLFQRFMKTTVEKQYQRLGLNNTGADHLTSYMRSTITGKACAYDSEDCTREANNLFNSYSATKINPIDPGLKSTVYCTAIRTGGEKEWQFAFELYNMETVASEKSRLLSALSCTHKPWLLNRMLGYTLQSDVIRKQDAYKVYTNVGRNKVGALISWNFFRENWNKIREIYGSGSFSLSDIIGGVTVSFNTEFILQQMKDFQSLHPDMGTGTRAFSQAIENVEANILWMKKNYDTLEQWLEQTVKS